VEVPAVEVPAVAVLVAVPVDDRGCSGYLFCQIITIKLL